MSDDLPEWARSFVHDARVGHLATTSSGEAPQPHVVPVCFVLSDEAICVAIDEKPKSGRRLQRLRNIEATKRASLVVDRYDEDWTRLIWVLARGRAEIIGPTHPRHAPALVALREKYPQYRQMTLDGSEMIVLHPERWSWWRADSAGE